MEIHEVRVWEHAEEWVTRAVGRARDVSIAVVGDYCLDHYMLVADDGIEVSVETGLKTRSVYRSDAYPGGAGNLAVNLATLGVGSVHAIGVVGADMYGRELRHLLRNSGVSIGSLVIADSSYSTQVYTKVYDQDVEEPRLDLGDYNTLSGETLECVLDRIRSVCSTVDLVLVNQQLRTGLFQRSSRRVVVEALRSASDHAILVDSRDFGRDFPHAYLKMNEHELRSFYHLGSVTSEHAVSESHDSIANIAADMARTQAAPVIVTLGSGGCLVAESATVYEIPGVVVSGPIDTVGAGDAFFAGTAMALGSGLDLPQAVSIGVMTASVTIRKVKQPGTASPKELHETARNADFRLAPLRVRTPMNAINVGELQIETIRMVPDLRRTYAIFDHDGTISVLREGWEPVMFQLMVEAIIGEQRPDLSLSRIRNVEDRVRSFIDETTGIQSIEQMHGLVELIREFGLCTPSNVLEPTEYKKRYLELLDARIAGRLENIRSGRLNADDYTIKGAVNFVRMLRYAGVSVFLASGSDHDAVVNEATTLGYADLFDGGIYGSVDDVVHDPKRVVLETILNRFGEQNAGGVVTFGDGPVEMRETFRQGGVAVGIASDEVRRHGLNERKRTRLIEAGASIVVGDFADPDRLIRLTGLRSDSL